MPKKPLRLPNGFGCVTVLKGRRRKPYQARTPILGYRDGTGTPIQQSLGCYETYAEAYQAVLDYNKNKSAPSPITFAEVYAKAIDAMKRSGEERAENTYKLYDSRFRSLAQLHDKPIADIRLSDLQQAIDNQPPSKSTRNVTMAVCHLIYDYACKYDLCEKDYSAYLSANAPSTAPDPEKYFYDGELNIIKSLADTDETAMRLLVMCYTGFRIAAYDTWEVHEGYVVGGVKQKRSKEYKPRIVPIHPKIAKYIPDFYLPPHYSFNRQQTAFELAHGIRRLTPHATRHTFSYLLDKAKVDDVTAKMLMGHSLGSDVHTNVYKHRSFEQLKEAIEALPF